MSWRHMEAALDYMLAEYLPDADARLIARINAATVESGAVEFTPLDRTDALRAWADDLERRKQHKDGCQGVTVKGTKCRSRQWPYCCEQHERSARWTTTSPR